MLVEYITHEYCQAIGIERLQEWYKYKLDWLIRYMTYKVLIG